MTGVFIEDKLAGCTIHALLHGNYEIGLFLKVDYQYERIYNYLVSATTASAKSSGSQFMNIEHDLGIKGIREAKQQLHPSHMFSKYRVSYS